MVQETLQAWSNPRRAAGKDGSKEPGKAPCHVNLWTIEFWGIIVSFKTKRLKQLEANTALILAKARENSDFHHHCGLGSHIM